jgi:hypothetical protein
MMDIGLLGKPRRGVPIGTFLVWILIAAAAGAVGWEIYGSVVRARLGIGQDQKPSSPSAPVAAPTNDDLVAAVNDVQASQKRIADRLEAALVLLNAEQASSKTTADNLAALSAKVDALQHPPPAPAAAAKRPAAVRPPPAPRPPVAASPEPEPAPAPGTAAPRDQ